jgi:hypothetical protein
MRFVTIKQHLCVLLCGWLLSACVHTDVAATGRALEESLASLPSSAEFTSIATTPTSSYPDRIDQRCTYGRVSRALVTDLAPSDATAAYTQLLETVGWVVVEPLPSPSLERGQHELIVLHVVDNDNQAWAEPFTSSPAYRAARAQQRPVLIVDLTYKAPQRDGC